MAGERTLILGIGNTLLRDEGIGVHVVRHLRGVLQASDACSLLDGGTLSFTLAGDLAAHQRLVVVDAARMGVPPGEVRCFEGAAMDRYLRGSRRSVHEVGLGDLVDIARLSGTLPRRRALVGIEPERIDWGEQPSPALLRAIPVAAARIRALLRSWESNTGQSARRTDSGHKRGGQECL